jgi:PKD repeat protein
MNSVVIQQTSFEHSYSTPGNYTVIMTVRSQNGEETKTTATVNVVGSTLKCWNAGISYNEGASLSCLTNSDGTRACIADASHVCRSGVWKIEGGLWYQTLPR